MTGLTARYDSGAYIENTPDWHASDAPWKTSKIVKMLQAHALTPSSVCDVGCGAGEILVQLQKALPAARLTGFDTSATAIGICKDKSNTKLNFHHADFAATGSDRYELALCLDVFEHVPDYLGFLQSLSRRADKFVFHIPLDINATTVFLGSRYMMYMRRNFGHLHYFTKETALATLEQTGYRIVDWDYTWDREIHTYPRRHKGLFNTVHYAVECAILTVERLTNRRFPTFWARLRKEYNLIVLAEPIARPVR